MKLGNRACCALAFLSCLFLVQISLAATISVGANEQIKTIQHGISIAADGDTVLVSPGRYFEHIDFTGKELHLKGAGPEVTIIDGSGGPGACVKFASGEGRGAVIEGFLLTGGTGEGVLSGSQGYGGGVFILDSEPTIRNNAISFNTARPQPRVGAGGGIYCSSQTQPVR